MSVNWQAQVQEVLEPLRRTLAAFDNEVERLEAELRDVRASRRSVKRVLDAADEKSKPGPKGPRGVGGRRPGSGGTPGQGAENMRAVGEWIQANAERFADGIVAREAEAAWQEHGVQRSRGAFNNYLAGLADQGVLRLDRLDGNTKIYKLTSEGGGP